METGVAGSIFELRLPYFGKIHIFFQDVQMTIKSDLDIFNGTKITKKSKSLWVHSGVVLALAHCVWAIKFQ